MADAWADDAPGNPTRTAAVRWTLPRLLTAAMDSNAGVDAAQAGLVALESQLIEARRGWLPQFELNSLVAPGPKLRCTVPPGAVGDPNDRAFREANCVGTTSANVNLDIIGGVFTYTEVKVVSPLYTFGKLASVRSAAENGVALGRGRVEATRAQVVFEVKRAYYGAKLADEILGTLQDGEQQLVKAKHALEEELDADKGDATETDLLRLRAFEADVVARRLETKRLLEIALAGLRTLLGRNGPESGGRGQPLLLDDEPLTPLPPGGAGVLRPVEHYVSAARAHRPETRMLGAAVGARHAATSLERARLWPDVVLLGNITYAYSSASDDPQNAFANDPFNQFGGGVAVGLRYRFDVPLRMAQIARVTAEEAETRARQREALGGIALEVEKAYREVQEARERIDVTERGQKAAHSWLVATAQNLAAGLAETRDVTDALLAYFQLRLRYLQSIYDHNVAVAALERAVGTSM
jgi:outer membrane protein TolC